MTEKQFKKYRAKTDFKICVDSAISQVWKNWKPTLETDVKLTAIEKKSAIASVLAGYLK